MTSRSSIRSAWCKKKGRQVVNNSSKPSHFDENLTVRVSPLLSQPFQVSMISLFFVFFFLKPNFSSCACVRERLSSRFSTISSFSDVSFHSFTINKLFVVGLVSLFGHPYLSFEFISLCISVFRTVSCHFAWSVYRRDSLYLYIIFFVRLQYTSLFHLWFSSTEKFSPFHVHWLITKEKSFAPAFFSSCNIFVQMAKLRCDQFFFSFSFTFTCT